MSFDYTKIPELKRNLNSLMGELATEEIKRLMHKPILEALDAVEDLDKRLKKLEAKTK